MKTVYTIKAHSDLVMKWGQQFHLRVRPRSKDLKAGKVYEGRMHGNEVILQIDNNLYEDAK